MFDWIIEMVNRGLYINDPESMVIGVLDIYGFEIFGVRDRERRETEKKKSGADTDRRGRVETKRRGKRNRKCAIENVSYLFLFFSEKRLRTVLYQLCEREASADLH